MFVNRKGPAARQALLYHCRYSVVPVVIVVLVIPVIVAGIVPIIILVVVQSS